MPELYNIEVHRNVRIPVRDGLLLSANLWIPVPRTSGEKFPAILEMIPYRKDDWRYQADHSRMTYLAQRGYVGCRLDIRGTGSSPGIALDEYMSEETEDGYDAVEWLAVQDWCDGSIGMWGISYGGFTAIQVAMLQPPHLKAIVPMYATDDRYMDDVHYVGGCLTASEFAQYAVSQIGMNAMPPQPEFAGADWAAQWKARLEHTPPWTIEWLRHQSDGPYWRSGSLAPNYDRIQCAIFHIAGWMDGYTNPALRMQQHCTAPCKTLIGNWVHSLPDDAYPGPNLDWLHEMVRFFDYWLKGIDNGVMDEPPLVYFQREYTPPEAFPEKLNGEWVGQSIYPPPATEVQTLYFGDCSLENEPLNTKGKDHYPHRPTLGTAAALCYGAGVPPTGLARDLRPDEALSLVYTSDPLDLSLDVLGFPEAVLHVSSTAPVATVVVRLTDVHPDGTSALVSTGVLNLTHRYGHDQPAAIMPGEMMEVRVPFKATGYRFLPGHCVRITVASGYWPALWPSPYRADNVIHWGAYAPSRLELPTLLHGAPHPDIPEFKITPPVLENVGGGFDEPAVWQIVQDVIAESVTVKVYDGGTSVLPDGRTLFISEKIDMTTYEHDPAHTHLFNEVIYDLKERTYHTHIRATGSIRSTETDFHIDVQLVVTLNDAPFFQRAWIETIPRNCV
jgi:uncharacterized protein